MDGTQPRNAVAHLSCCGSRSNEARQRAACWIAGLQEALVEKNRDKGHKFQQKDDFIETRVSNLEPGNVVKLNNQLNLVERIQENKGIYTLIVIHRNRRDARSFFASETVMKKVS